MSIDKKHFETTLFNLFFHSTTLNIESDLNCCIIINVLFNAAVYIYNSKKNTFLGGNTVEKIAIVGMGCRFPGGANDPEKFWDILVNGKDATSDIPNDRWEVEKFYNPNKSQPGKHYMYHGGFLDRVYEFDEQFFGISPREASFLDPQQRLMLEVSWEALEDAGFNPYELAGSSVGVYVGGFTLDYKLLQFKTEGIEHIDTHTAVGVMMTMLSNRISYIYDFKGPSMTVDTACSSSLVTIHLACRSILNNECKMALAGGVNLMLTPDLTIAECKGGFLSPDGRCKTFDSSANGYARGEGAGLVVLKRLSDAIKDNDHIYAVIKASGVNQDGHTNGITVPNPESQTALMKEVFNKANVLPGEIQYIEAHGTGTPVGDPLEANAIAKALSEGRKEGDKCIVGSLKTNFGHLESAAGIAGLIKTSLILKNKQIPPHLHFKNPNPKIPFDELCIRVPTTLETWPDSQKTAIAGVNSFGFGGTNAHILLEEAPYKDRIEVGENAGRKNWPFVVPVSAKSEEALKEMCWKYVDFINSKSQDQSFSLYELGYNMANRKAHLENRLTVCASSLEELAQNLESYASGQLIKGMANSKEEAGKYNKVVFVYTGMGPIWWAMGRELLQKDEVFRSVIEKCDKLTKKIAGWSLMEELTADEANSKLDQPQFAQPANFALQIALTEVWKSLGIVPEAVVGHSVGEVASTYAAGIYSLEDAMTVSIHRSIVQQKAMGKGTMLALGLSEGEAREVIKGMENIDIAAVNSSNSVTLSGSAETIDKILEKLSDSNIFAKKMKVNVAYHSYQMEPYKKELLEALKNIKPQKPSIEIYSTVVSKHDEKQGYDGSYWWRNVREHVRFERAMYEIIDDGHNLFIEVGPHPVLSTYIKDCMSIKKANGIILPSIRRKEDEQLTMMETWGNLFAIGYPVDYSKLYPVKADVITLPVYAWQRKKFWRDDIDNTFDFKLGWNKHKLLGRAMPNSLPTWEKEVNMAFMDYIGDHKISGTEVFPGAGYFELASACAKEYYGEDYYAIENMKFEKALFLNNQGVSPVIQLCLNPQTGSFQISSRIPGKERIWTQHSSGVVSKRQNTRIKRVGVLDDVRKRCFEEFEKDSLYKTFAEMGFNYGPCFQGIEKVFRGKDEVLALIKVPDYIDLDDQNYTLHPAVLDSCFQSLVALVAPMEGFMPVEIERIQVYGRPKPVMWCHGVQIEIKGKELTGDIFVYDEDENLIAEIIAMKTKAVESSSSFDVGKLDDWLFEVNWTPLEDHEELEVDSNWKKGAWLVLADNSGIGEQLSAKFKEKGDECFIVSLEEENDAFYKDNEFSVKSGDMKTIEAIFDKIQEESKLQLKGIVHMWSINTLSQNADSLCLKKVNDEGCLSLKHIVQVIGERGLTPKLWVVTSMAQMISPETPLQGMAQSSIWGIGRVIGHQEAPAKWGGLIDLEIGDAGVNAELLFNEIVYKDKEDQIAIRDGKRYGARIGKQDIKTSAIPFNLPANGSYLVTGAFGAIGMLVGRWIVKHGARHVILMSRSSVPARKTWNDIKDGDLLEKVAYIKELEAMGATVHLAAVDVGEETQLREFIKEYTEEGWPQIRGVIHSAGIVRDQFLQQMEDKVFNQVINPKIFAAWNLHKVLMDFPIDFFVLFSSTGSTLVSMGQAAYASGNAFIDALSHYRLQKGLPALSINWGPWAEVGMAAKLNLVEHYRERGMESVTPVSGMAVMDRLMWQNVSQAIVLPIISWELLGEKHYPMAEPPRIVEEVIALEAKNKENDGGKQKTTKNILEEIASCNEDERLTITINYLKEIIAKTLRYDLAKLNENEPLAVFGMDSMMATEIRNRIELGLEIPLSVVELLKGASIKDLAENALIKLKDSGKLTGNAEGSDNKAGSDAELMDILPVEEQQYYEVSSAQRRLYILNSIDVSDTSYNQPVVRLVHKFNLDKKRMEDALKALAGRHEILRTSFKMIDGEPKQIISKEIDINVQYYEENDKAKINDIIKGFIRPFDMEKAPLFRAGIIKIDEDNQILLFDMHHILTDGSSMIILFREFFALCNHKELPPLKTQYKDFAAWQNKMFHTESMKKQEQYWTDLLEGEIPVLNLPTDYKRPSIQSFEGDRFEFNASGALVENLKLMAHKTNTTVFMILLASFNTLLHKYTGQEDIIVGSPITGRTHPNLQNVIGMFVNTLVLRNYPQSHKSFAEFLDDIKESSLRAFENQDYQFEQLVEKLHIKRDLSRNPLFDVMFNMLPVEDSIKENDGVNYSYWEFENKTSKFDLSMAVRQDDGLAFEFEYCTKLFGRATIEKFAAHFINILEAVTENMDIKLSEIDILSEAEKQQLVIDFNNTKKKYSSDKTISRLFEEQVEKTPDSIAVSYEGSKLSYRELNEKANLVASSIVRKGIQKDSVVGIMTERSVNMIVGILGILKAGCGYMPIDPDYPADRINHMLSDSDCKLVLTLSQDTGAEKLSLKEIINITDLKVNSPDDTLNRTSNADAESLAYVIFTSGSTGKPKGVMIEQRSVINLVEGLKQRIYKNFKKSLKVALVASFSFDASVQQIFAALLNGHHLNIVPDDVKKSGEELFKFYIKNSIEISDGTPIHLGLLSEYISKYSSSLTVKHFIIGGDKLLSSLVEAFLSKFEGNKPAITNIYGPTECCVDSTAYSVDLNEISNFDVVPVGKPLTNQQVYILGDSMELLPVGVAGQMYIGGDGLARGYLNSQEMTNERFVPNPFTKGKKLYKTGDHARWLPDGNIEFLGRMDGQVKLRGYRIELGEIESELIKHPLIKEAVVISGGVESDKYLCAYFVSQDELVARDLREHLLKVLPDYMVPAYFVRVDSIPLTTSGKVDRKALPQPDGSLQTGTVYEAPSGELEETLVRIWEEVLDISPIGVNHNFFELGGHSLKAMLILAKIHKELMVDMPLREIFRLSTIKLQAEYIVNSEQIEYQAIKPSGKRKLYPVSSAQRRLYVLNSVEGDNIAYNIPEIMIIEGQLDVERFKEALNTVTKRHEVLRSSFEMSEGEVLQRVHGEVEPEFTYKIAMDGRDKEDAKVWGFIEDFIRPFNINTAPLLRTCIVRLALEKYLLMFDMHHIVSDGISVDILKKEISELYNGKALPQMTIQYGDYAVWQNEMLKTKSFKKQEEYWMNNLSGELPVLNMPADYTRPSMQSYEGNSISFEMDKEVMGKLALIAKETGSTMYMVLLCAYSILLYKYSGQKDIIIGSPIAQRPNAELEGLIGMFVNTLAIRTKPSGDMTVKELLRKVRETALNAYDNKDYSFEELVEKLDLKRDMSRNPIFDTMFVLQNMKADNFDLKGLKCKPHKVEHILSKFDLTLYAFEGSDKTEFTIEYCTKLFKKETIERLKEHFINVLKGFVSGIDKKICEIDIMAQKEKEQILHVFNNTKADYPGNKTIIELFQEKAKTVPENNAVIFKDKVITFSELDEKSNQVARILREKGVGPDTLVGLILERSLEMIIGIIAVLKAGGAYLPISPDYPEDRIRFLVEDSDVKLLLVQSRFMDMVSGIEAVNLEDKALYRASCQQLEIVAKPNNLAYVIYTSGSTGKPKGVMIENYSVINRLNWMQRMYPIGKGDVILQKTPYTFDVSVWELFWWSLTGAGVCMLEPGGEKDPSVIVAAIEKYSITTMHFVPSMLNTFLDYVEGMEDRSGLKSLKQVFASGEALNASQVNRFNKLLNKAFGTKLHNLYGPTEATVDVSYFDCSKTQEIDIVPIGKPIDNIKLYIIDKNKSLCPVGVTGELCIAGDGLARGYLNRAELTAEKFVPNPFEKGKRMYRTGDLARWMPDGNIEYLGRIDHQVKIRGYRIELGEIESLLLELNGVKEAVVITRADKNGNQYLCGYCVCDRELNVKELREHLSEKLPEYMIPSHFVKLDKMPLSANGKVDRKVLPEPDDSIGLGTEYEAPQNELQQRLVEMWEEVLGKQKIGIKDNFFELGGDSIKAIQIASRLNRYNFKVEVRDILTNPTIEELCSYVTVSFRKAEQGVIQGEVNLTPIQSWFFDMNFTEMHHWNQAVMVYREKGLEEEIVRKVASKILEHHDILRAVFKKEGGRIIEVHNEIEEQMVDLKVYDLKGTEDYISKIGELSNQIQGSIDLSKGPLVKFGLFKTLTGDHLLIAAHHLVVDGVSWRIILEDMERGYNQALNGEEMSFQDKTDSYKLWSEKLRLYANSREIQKEAEYWSKLEKIKVEELKKDNKVETDLVKDTNAAALSLSEEETDKLMTKINHAYNTDVKDILLAALGLSIKEWSKVDKVLVDLEGHGREEIFGDIDIKRTVGWFTSMYPVILDMKNAEDLSAYIINIKESLRKIPNKGVGYGILKYLSSHEIKSGLQFGLKPEICFNYLGEIGQEIGASEFGLSNAPVGYTLSPNSERPHAIYLNGMTVGGKLNIQVSYNKNSYKEETISEFIEKMEKSLNMIIDHCMSADKTELTPSDFEDDDLSIEELNKIYENFK